MITRKQANGNLRITLSDTELIDALESTLKDVYENISDTAVIQAINTRYGNIEIIIGDQEED